MDNTNINSLLEYIKNYCNNFQNHSDCHNENDTEGNSEENEEEEEEEEGEECNFDPSGGANSNYCKNANSDIPGGFQDVNPELFIAIGDILGLIMSCNLPFNVQNALGNWLQLVGQAILTYNAQQQYFMGGPGRYFGPQFRNVNNPFYSSSTDESGKKTPKAKKTSTKSTKSNTSDIVELQCLIKDLTKEVENLKSEINEIKKKK